MFNIGFKSAALVMGGLVWAYQHSEAGITGTARCQEGTRAATGVVVFLEPDHKPALPPPQTVVLDQKNLTFVPRVLAVMVGTTVRFPNSDSVRHNVFSASDTRMFNLGTYPPGASRSVTLPKAGLVEVLCNVHPEMAAYILVLETPYFTTTDAGGRFEIPHVPPGTYQLRLWCEHQPVTGRRIELKGGERLAVDARLHLKEIAVKPVGTALPEPE